MQQLIYFLQKYKYFLYFLCLQCIGFALIFQNNSFHRSKFINSTNYFIGSYYHQKTNLSDYLDLKNQNKALAAENESLRNQVTELQNITEKSDNLHTKKDSVFQSNFKYIKGKIIKNDYRYLSNYLTATAGKKQGIDTEIAVINAKGIIGVTDDLSANYSRIRSILNKKTKINARFKNNFYFGTLQWDGNDYRVMQLTDIPRQAAFIIGDTIVTGGKSAIFPEGIPIGSVISKPKKTSATNTLDILLFNDMSNIKHIYFIKNKHIQEIKKLENEPKE